MECIRISKAGYPTRRPYDLFVNRYKLLAIRDIERELNNKKRDSKLLCETIIKAIGVDNQQYQMGITKVFLRAGQVTIQTLLFVHII